jgi:hypothetical protein
MKRAILIFAGCYMLSSCSKMITVSATATKKHQGHQAVTTEFKTAQGGIFFKRGFKWNYYEIGQKYDLKVNPKHIYTENR